MIDHRQPLTMVEGIFCICVANKWMRRQEGRAGGFTMTNVCSEGRGGGRRRMTRRMSPGTMSTYILLFVSCPWQRWRRHIARVRQVMIMPMIHSPPRRIVIIIIILVQKNLFIYAGRLMMHYPIVPMIPMPCRVFQSKIRCYWRRALSSVKAVALKSRSPLVLVICRIKKLE
jgi:hypothetical protein